MAQPFVLRLPETIKELLEAEAKRQKQSAAEVARRALSLYLKNKPKQKSGIEVLLEWAKKEDKPTKKTDVTSTNYKDYLYGPKSPKFGYLWKKKK